MSKNKNILVVNGPNLNLLGSRQNDIYGNLGLGEINQNLIDLGKTLNVTLEFFQSNHEGLIIDKLQSAKTNSTHGMLINLGAFTHTSIAIYDTLLAIDLPFVEVHLSNIFAREKFRHASYISRIAIGVITGFGPKSYVYGLMALSDHIQKA